MQATATQTNPARQTRPKCSMDYALADIAAGRINHYNSLEELKKSLDISIKEAERGEVIHYESLEDLKKEIG